jgi:hypothetical protein
MDVFPGGPWSSGTSVAQLGGEYRYILQLHIHSYCVILSPIIIIIVIIFMQGKVKEIPLQAWRGPEGAWSFKLPDFKTIGT